MATGLLPPFSPLVESLPVSGSDVTFAYLVNGPAQHEQKSIAWLQREHSSMLSSLHEEIWSLKSRMSDLKFQLTLAENKQPTTCDQQDKNDSEQEKLLSKYQEAERCISALEEKLRQINDTHSKEIEAKEAIIEALQKELGEKAAESSRQETEITRLQQQLQKHCISCVKSNEPPRHSSSVVQKEIMVSSTQIRPRPSKKSVAIPAVEKDDFCVVAAAQKLSKDAAVSTPRDVKSISRPTANIKAASRTAVPKLVSHSPAVKTRSHLSADSATSQPVTCAATTKPETDVTGAFQSETKKDESQPAVSEVLPVEFTRQQHISGDTKQKQQLLSSSRQQLGKVAVKPQTSEKPKPMIAGAERKAPAGLLGKVGTTSSKGTSSKLDNSCSESKMPADKGRKSAKAAKSNGENVD